VRWPKKRDDWPIEARAKWRGPLSVVTSAVERRTRALVKPIDSGMSAIEETSDRAASLAMCRASARSVGPHKTKNLAVAPIDHS